jgi:hypothetical protein
MDAPRFAEREPALVTAVATTTCLYGMWIELRFGDDSVASVESRLQPDADVRRKVRHAVTRDARRAANRDLAQVGKSRHHLHAAVGDAGDFPELEAFQCLELAEPLEACGGCQVKRAPSLQDFAGTGGYHSRY